MGASLFNAIARNGVRRDLVRSLQASKLDAYVAPEVNGVFAVALDELRCANPDSMISVTEWLSRVCETAILSCFIFDDDLMFLVLAERDEPTQFYFSDSYLLEGAGDELPERTIDPKRIAAAFGCPGNANAITDILAAVKNDGESYVLESDRYLALLTALNLPEWISAFGLKYLRTGDLDLPFEQKDIAVFQNSEV